MSADLWKEFRKIEPRILIALIGVIVMVWSTAFLTEEVMEGDTTSFDTWVVEALRSGETLEQLVGPSFLRDFMVELTVLAGYPFMTLVGLSALGFLLLERAWARALYFTIALAGGAAVATLLKQIFERARPDAVPHLVEVGTSYSFPSTHAFLAAVFYLTSAALLSRALTRRRTKIYVMSVAVLVTLIVGVTRVFIGVHYPTDVMAGWIFGSLWALVCWGGAHLTRRALGARRGKPLEDRAEPAPEPASHDDEPSPEARKTIRPLGEDAIIELRPGEA